MDLANIIGMHGLVTHIDILTGIGGDCERCPVALAVGRMFPDYEIHVDVVEIYINKDGKSQLKLFVTDNLFTWIDTFDNENTVELIELVIRETTEEDFQLELAIA